jgi:hypothetical protein
MCYGQQDSTWNKWNWLIGKWKSDGNGAPSDGKCTYSFKLNLDDNILEGRLHTEYPATADQPSSVHDELLIIYKDLSGHPFKAIYFDNKGNAVKYDIKHRDRKIILTSEWVTGMPIYRITYFLPDEGLMNTTSEISKDGKDFIIYEQVRSKKLK